MFDTIIHLCNLLFQLSAFAALAVLLKRSVSKSLYSYRNAGLFGGLLFAGFILLLSLRIYIVALYKGQMQGVTKEMLYLFVSSAEKFIVVSAPFLFLLFTAAAISNVQLIRREGIRPRNMLGVILGTTIFLAIIGVTVGWNFFAQNVLNTIYLNGYHWIQIVNSSVQLFLGSLICYMECMMLGTIVFMWKASHHKPKYDKDYVIILGCAIAKDGTPYPLLRGRIDRAIAFAEEQKKKTGKSIKFIPSGGKGDDECISEAESMKNYLLSKGIAEDDIIIENQSTTTLENMRFSKEKTTEGAKIIFSTSNYHVFRSGIYANQAGLSAEGIGSKTKSYFWPNASIREFVALLASKKRVHVITAAFLLLFSILIGSANYAMNLPER